VELTKQEFDLLYLLAARVPAWCSAVPPCCNRCGATSNLSDGIFADSLSSELVTPTMR